MRTTGDQDTVFHIQHVQRRVVGQAQRGPQRGVAGGVSSVHLAEKHRLQRGGRRRLARGLVAQLRLLEQHQRQPWLLAVDADPLPRQRPPLERDVRQELVGRLLAAGRRIHTGDVGRRELQLRPFHLERDRRGALQLQQVRRAIVEGLARRQRQGRARVRERDIVAENLIVTHWVTCKVAVVAGSIGGELQPVVHHVPHVPCAQRIGHVARALLHDRDGGQPPLHPEVELEPPLLRRREVHQQRGRRRAGDRREAAQLCAHAVPSEFRRAPASARRRSVRR